MPDKEKKITSETIANIITELVNHYSNEYIHNKNKLNNNDSND